MKSVFKLLNIVVAGVLIFTAIGVAYIALPFFGNQALIVRSGSMSPTIGVGSVAVVSARQNLPVYKTGDVIAFRSEKNSKTIITHRIVGVEPLKSGGIVYKTKGDANKDPDATLVKQENVLGKTHIVVPYVGKILAFAKSDIGFPLLIIFPAVFVILLEAISIIREIRKKRRQHKNELPFGFRIHPGGGVPLAHQDKFKFFGFKILIPLLVFSLFIPSTFAFFSDSEVSTGNVFQAAEVFPTPTPIPVSAGDVVINEINWVGSDLTGQTGQNDEWIELRNTTGNPINLSGWKITGAIVGDGDLNIASGIIPANGFFLISNFDENTSRINVAPDIVTTDIQLDNANAQYILKDSIGNTIDTADDDSGVALAGTNGPPKRSMERKTPPGDGTLGTNWQDSNAHTNMDGSGSTDEFGTPKATNSGF